MENNSHPNTRQVTVRLTEAQNRLPSTILSSLPEILKLEIEHPLFKDSGEQQLEALNKIIRMLSVQFQDDTDRKIRGFEWTSFCQNFRLTAPEIVQAYRMALAKELGEIKVFPNLSLITAGEILNAYIEFKRHDKALENGRKKLDKELNPDPIITKEQAREQKIKLWKELQQHVSQNTPCAFAFLFYDDLIRKGHFKQFLSNEDAQRLLLKKKMHEIIRREFFKPVIFSKHEAKKLYKELQEGKEIPVHNLAVVEAKNDLVYNLVKKIIKKQNS